MRAAPSLWRHPTTTTPGTRCRSAGAVHPINFNFTVGGFLGMGTKLVAVPYTQLKLGDTKNASSDNKVVMPGATKESLKAQPEFKYTNRG
jgi:hypothetical protein